MREPIWQPTAERAAATQMAEFRALVAERYGLPSDDFVTVHEWSCRRPDEFWAEMWHFAGVIGALSSL